MNRLDAVKLCQLVKACCPSQQFDEYTPDAWALILGRYSFDDARHAVEEIVSAPLELGRSRYIEPGHIVTVINRARGVRLGSTPMPAPPAGLDPAEYATWHNRTREAIANGTYVPAEEPAIPPATRPWRELIDTATPELAHVPEHQERRRIPDIEQIVDEAQIAAERARQQAELATRIRNEANGADA